MPRRNVLFSNHFSWPGQLFLHTLEMPLNRLKFRVLGDTTRDDKENHAYTFRLRFRNTSFVYLTLFIYNNYALSLMLYWSIYLSISDVNSQSSRPRNNNPCAFVALFRNDYYNNERKKGRDIPTIEILLFELKTPHSFTIFNKNNTPIRVRRTINCQY